jgi:hypothetical protein
MPPAGFEQAILASERLQTYASDGAVIGIGPIEDFSLKLRRYL